MKNTKLFIFAAAALLAAVSFVITKAEKKVIHVTSARFPALSIFPITGLDASHFTTIKGLVGKTVFLVTRKNGLPALATLTTNITTFTAKVYWH